MPRLAVEVAVAQREHRQRLQSAGKFGTETPVTDISDDVVRDVDLTNQNHVDFYREWLVQVLCFFLRCFFESDFFLRTTINMSSYSYYYICVDYIHRGWVFRRDTPARYSLLHTSIYVFSYSYYYICVVNIQRGRVFRREAPARDSWQEIHFRGRKQSGFLTPREGTPPAVPPAAAPEVPTPFVPTPIVAPAVAPAVPAPSPMKDLSSTSG